MFTFCNNQSNNLNSNAIKDINGIDKISKKFNEKSRLFLEFYSGMTSDECDTVIFEMLKNGNLNQIQSNYFYTLNYDDKSIEGKLYLNFDNPINPYNFLSVSILINQTDANGADLAPLFWLKEEGGFRMSDKEISNRAKQNSEVFNDLVNLFSIKYKKTKKEITFIKSNQDISNFKGLFGKKK